MVSFLVLIIYTYCELLVQSELSLREPVPMDRILPRVDDIFGWIPLQRVNTPPVDRWSNSIDVHMLQSVRDLNNLTFSWWRSHVLLFNCPTVDELLTVNLDRSRLERVKSIYLLLPTLSIDYRVSRETVTQWYPTVVCGREDTPLSNPRWTAGCRYWWRKRERDGYTCPWMIKRGHRYLE